MTHKTLSDAIVGEPPPVVVFDRRRAPSRRVEWRGGRRDTDWLNRPLGALARVGQPNGSTSGWRSWLLALHI